jgi:hypothetical protein
MIKFFCSYIYIFVGLHFICIMCIYLERIRLFIVLIRFILYSNNLKELNIIIFQKKIQVFLLLFCSIIITTTNIKNERIENNKKKKKIKKLKAHIFKTKRIFLFIKIAIKLLLLRLYSFKYIRNIIL